MTTSASSLFCSSQPPMPLPFSCSSQPPSSPNQRCMLLSSTNRFSAPLQTHFNHWLFHWYPPLSLCDVNCFGSSRERNGRNINNLEDLRFLLLFFGRRYLFDFLILLLFIISVINSTKLRLLCPANSSLFQNYRIKVCIAGKILRYFDFAENEAAKAPHLFSLGFILNTRKECKKKKVLAAKNKRKQKEPARIEVFEKTLKDSVYDRHIFIDSLDALTDRNGDIQKSINRLKQMLDLERESNSLSITTNI